MNSSSKWQLLPVGGSFSLTGVALVQAYKQAHRPATLPAGASLFHACMSRDSMVADKPSSCGCRAQDLGAKVAQLMVDPRLTQTLCCQEEQYLATRLSPFAAYLSCLWQGYEHAA